MHPTPLRDEAAARDRRLIERLDTIVPRIMQREGIDAWVVAGREYNEDPVLATMLPATWISARRRTVVVFTDFGRSRHAVARYAVGDAFPTAWDPEEEPDQWAAVGRLLADADPVAIAVNRSATTALADGISASECDAFTRGLPPELRDRIVPGEALAIGWLETRTDEEIDRFRAACVLGHEIIAEGFSPSVVTPGRTTTEDLEWWFRERVRALALQVWFQPTVSVQRAGSGPRTSFAAHPGTQTVRHGDLLHVDFGIVFEGLHTDQQQHAYVLQPGQDDAPDGLRAALAIGNTLQGMVIAEFAEGRTGNDVLASAREAAIDAGIRPRIYSHPIGLHGHAAGPSIGLWDSQDGVPGAGDLPIRPDTAWSIELSAAVDVPEWDGQTVSIMLEEDAVFSGGSVDWLDGRQTRFHLIG